MTPAPEPPYLPARAGIRWGWALALAAAAGLLAYGDHRLRRVEQQLGTLAEETRALTRAMHLYRFEQTSNSGLGVDALVEKLAYWSPQLATAATPAAEVPAIQRKVQDVIEAVRGLGPSAAPELEQRFHAAASEQEDELRKWLCKAVVAANPERGKELLMRILRGLEFRVSQRLREYAAEELMAIDRAAAGRLLRDILSYESSQGIDERRIPREYVERFPEAVYAHSGHRPGFFNFVIRYTATGDPAIEDTLIMLLGRHEQDLMTIQECVKELGRMRSRASVEKIKQLYATPPAISQNPIFQRHCLEAVGQILERDACAWFESLQREERNEILAAKLVELRQRYCQ